jgi:hypothetical protein
MPFRVQIGAEDVYIENPECGGALVDVPPENELQIKGLTETHPYMREPSAYEEGLLLTFFIEEHELPFRPCYYAISEEFIGQPERCYSKGGDAPIA